MTVVVALLRGVNVGGNGKLAMADLREVAADCGIGDARTYIQSGNLVGTTKARATAPLARSLQAAISASCGITPDVTIRTAAELAQVVERNPFLSGGAAPEHLHVIFGIDDGPAEVPLEGVARYEPERVEAVGRDLHLLLPNGMGNSKLAADLSRRKGARGTARNWRTINKLLEMCEELR